jgi:hypothetical protein
MYGVLVAHASMALMDVSCSGSVLSVRAASSVDQGSQRYAFRTRFLGYIHNRNWARI